MKNPAPYLRQKIGELLAGSVVYNTVEIPVYGNDTDHDDPLQIVIGEYSDGDRSNKHGFEANATQVIEVQSRQATAAKKTVDAIGDLVMDLIHPTTQSNLLDGTDFSVNVLGRPSINYLPEKTGDNEFIVRLILRYNLLISHN